MGHISRLIRGQYAYDKDETPEPCVSFSEFSSTPRNNIVKSFCVYRYTFRCAECRKGFDFYFRDAEMYEHEVIERLGSRDGCEHMRGD